MENTPIFLSETRRAPLAADKVIGRAEELEAVASGLERGDSLLLLHGLGGLGKTTLAGFYLERCGHRYCHAAWVNYTGHFRGDLVRQLRHSRILALTLPDENQEEAFSLLVEAMEALPHPNLLIVDNLNTLEHLGDVAAHRTRLPRGWNVLLTARVTSTAFEDCCSSIGVLSEDEAAALFCRHYTFRPDDIDAQLRDLLCHIGCHTLVVELLAKTLATAPSWHLARMGKHLREKGLLQLDMVAAVSTAHSRDRAVMLEYVAAIFEVNIGSLGERARPLLARLALLPPLAHTFERLTFLEKCDGDESRDLLAATLNHLTTNGLLEAQTIPSGGTTQSRATTFDLLGWYMHPVIQEVVRTKWPPDYDGCAAMLQVLKNALDNWPLPESLPLLPYAQTVVEHLKFSDIRLVDICWKIFDRNCDTGNFDIAEHFIRETNRLYEEAGDKRNIGVTSKSLGELALNQGKFEEALTYFEKATELFEELFAADPHSESLKNDLAISYEKSGSVYRAQGKFDEALAYFEKRTKLGEELFDADPRSESLKNGLAKSYFKLGDLCQAQGKFGEALAYFEKDLKLTKELFDADPRSESLKNDLAISYEKLGDLCQAQNKFGEALAYFEKRTKLGEELFAADPRSESLKNDLAISYEKLGDLCQAQGEFDKALAYFEKGLKLTEELLAADSRSERLKNDLAILYEKLGSIHQAQGKFDSALAYFEKETELFEELFAADPCSERLKTGLAISYEKLGSIHQAQGKFDSALAYFEKETELFEELYAASPRSERLKNGLAISYEKLGGIYQAQGKTDEALAYFEKRAQLGEELYAASPRSESLGVGLGVSYIKLARCHETQNDPAQALHYYRKGLALYEQWHAVTRRPDVGGWIENVRRRIAALEG